MVLLLGSLGFLNSWDLPTFTALFLAALLLRAFHARAGGVRVRFRSVGLLMALIAVGTVLFYIPFYLDLDTQASGILPLRRSMTRPLHFALVWGPFLLLNLSLLAALSWDGFRRLAVRAVRQLLGRIDAPDPDAQVRRPDAEEGIPPAAVQGGKARWWRSSALWAAGLPLLPFALWAFVELGMSLAGSNRLLRPDHSGSLSESLLSIGSRFWHLLPFFIILGVGLALLFRKAQSEKSSSTPMQFVVLLMIFAFLLTMGAELFYISDFFGNRMNTVFKFYYQAWVLLAIGGAVALYFWTTNPAKGAMARKAGVPLLGGVFMLVLAAAFVYVPAAVYSKADRFKPDATLDSLAFAARANPQEFEAVLWLREHAKGDTVIVEAAPRLNGRPIGDYDITPYNLPISRISRRTGLPTILGWPGHEHQWRGNPYDPIAERSLDVETIYTDPDIEKVGRTLDKYHVTYVIAGGLERRVYGDGVGEHFGRFMDIAFQSGGVVIYERRAELPRLSRSR